MIGYYIHHHGAGHLIRAQSICTELDTPVTALTSLPIEDDPAFDRVVALPADNTASTATDATAFGALHWVPKADAGLRDRMAEIARWIATEKPEALVVDVSVEVALLARLHGVPVLTMVLPGTRTDAPHELVHRIADGLIAAWPRALYEPRWLRAYTHKTHYIGGISRYAGRSPLPRHGGAGRPTVLVLAGAGGSSFTPAMIHACAGRHPQYRWRTAGIDDWVDDLWPRLCAADVVISHAGQGTVADIAAAGKSAILIPADRPFGEQHDTATALAEAGMAVAVEACPAVDEWPELIEAARRLDTGRWRRWDTCGAAGRAAAVIGRIAIGSRSAA
ncbi:glycosyltransferase [Nocardia suismassiliense]|uniref:Glycosyltransferase n=1 Tax=Nocardia suismassiliense TaxID=2077092 RepID=A0ABW6QWK2_9NOCA